MAVEYEISSDVATVKGVASNTQVASIVKFYTGSITYDDEPTSKYATVTINGKSQRVMLCVAVSGTVVYDDVPCLYSTVSGHRTLNVVAPSESGTPDDVPSLYETIVVDGKTVRALRCVLINQTPNYDGVSSTCTFTDNGKTHTAQLVNKIVGGSIEVIVKGVSPLTLPDAIADSLSYVKAFGGTEQRNLPAEYTQVEYIESTGTQYIDTGLYQQDGDEFDIVYQQVTLDAAYRNIFGASNDGQSRTLYVSQNKSMTWAANNSSASYPHDTNKHTLVWVTSSSNSVLNCDGTNYEFNGEVTPSATLTVKVFARSALSSQGKMIGKIYSYKHKRNGSVIMDLVPAKNASNVVGMYDTVSGQFFTNRGTGTFAAGGEVVPTPDAPMDIVSNNGVLKARHQSGLPLGYTLLDYIKSNTNIPLGFYTNQNSEIEAKWYKDDAGAQYVYQANSGSALTNNTTAYATDGGGNWRFGNQTISIQAPLNTDIISIQNKNGVWFNNEQQGTYTNVNDFTGDVGFKALGVPTTGYSPMIRLSYIKHRQNGVLLGYYVPCVAPDNSIGLYDLIGGVFYTNAAATITAGTAVSDPVEIYTDGTVETIEDTIGNTATAEMLLKVGDYKDVQSIIDGAVTRNVGVLVLDGTEEIWGTVSQTPDTVTILTNCYTVVIPLGDAPIDKRRVYCTHLISSDTLPAADARQGYALLGNSSAGTPAPLTNKYAIGLGLTTRFPTIAGLKQWLADQYNAGTPVIIVYPLATETTESVTGQTLQVQAGDNTLEITQASMTGLELEAQYQASVSLTIQEVQDANLDPNVEVTIN